MEPTDGATALPGALASRCLNEDAEALFWLHALAIVLTFASAQSLSSDEVPNLLPPTFTLPALDGFTLTMSSPGTDISIGFASVFAPAACLTPIAIAGAADSSKAIASPIIETNVLILMRDISTSCSSVFSIRLATAPKRIQRLLACFG